MTESQPHSAEQQSSLPVWRLVASFVVLWVPFVALCILASDLPGFYAQRDRYGAVWVDFLTFSLLIESVPAAACLAMVLQRRHRNGPLGPYSWLCWIGLCQLVSTMVWITQANRELAGEYLQGSWGVGLLWLASWLGVVVVSLMAIATARKRTIATLLFASITASFFASGLAFALDFGIVPAPVRLARLANGYFGQIAVHLLPRLIEAVLIVVHWSTAPVRDRFSRLGTLYWFAFSVLSVIYVGNAWLR